MPRVAKSFSPVLRVTVSRSKTWSSSFIVGLINIVGIPCWSWSRSDIGPKPINKGPGSDQQCRALTWTGVARYQDMLHWLGKAGIGLSRVDGKW